MQTNEMTTRTMTRENRMMRRLTATGMMAALITLMDCFYFPYSCRYKWRIYPYGRCPDLSVGSDLPAPYAMAAGAIGGGLADLLTSPAWAPATIVIKMLIVLPFSSKREKIVTGRNILALPGAILITVAGYYLAEGLLFGFSRGSSGFDRKQSDSGCGKRRGISDFRSGIGPPVVLNQVFLREREQKRQKYGKMKWNIADGKRIFERAEGFDFVFFSVQSRKQDDSYDGGKERKIRNRKP